MTSPAERAADDERLARLRESYDGCREVDEERRDGIGHVVFLLRLITNRDATIATLRQEREAATPDAEALREEVGRQAGAHAHDQVGEDGSCSQCQAFDRLLERAPAPSPALQKLLTEPSPWEAPAQEPSSAGAWLRKIDVARAQGIARAPLFVDGEFTAHSGDMLPFKIDCDALTDADLATLAAEVARRFRFSSVYGVPRGGVRFAEALLPHRTTDGPLLIVDDVLTTGGSMQGARAQILLAGTAAQPLGVVIFARGPCPGWITPLFGDGAAGRAQGIAQGHAEMRERAAQIAEKALGGYLCPYGRDKEGDPTWSHTDKDTCPVCGHDGEGSLFACHDTYSGRIAAAIRALPDEENPDAE